MNSEVAQTSPNAIYREWLVPSTFSFVAAAIAMPSCYLVFLPINPAVGFWLGILLTLAIWLGMLAVSARIEVAAGELRVGKAHIPLKFLTDGRAIETEFRFAERGPGLDSRAFVRFQVGVKPLVRFENTDADDPTPYWLFSTRKPERLLAAVAASA